MQESYLLLSLFWLLFCVFHSVLADQKIKNILSRSVVFRWIPYRIVYNIWAFISLASVLIYHFSFPSTHIWQSILITQLAGCMLSLAGLIIMFICIKKYFRQLSGLEDSFKDVLQVAGIHTFVRHPLYAGTFLFISGLFIIFPTCSNLIATLIIIIYTLIGIVLEEKKLVNHFGDQYLRYKKDVPALIPKIFSR